VPVGDDEGGIAYDALRRQSAWDVVHKEFEHEVTRRVLLWMGFATFQPPTRGGTGALPVSITSGRLEFGWATPIGGSGALPAALPRSSPITAVTSWSTRPSRASLSARGAPTVSRRMTAGASTHGPRSCPPRT
jgi:hypothetical protein